MATQDAIASTSPLRSYKHSGEYFAALREHVLDILSTESVENQCSSLFSGVLVASLQWADHDCPPSDLTENLTFTWWRFLTVGMSTSSAIDHQRLLHFLATVKQIGHLPPNGSPALLDGKNNEQGRLWADLPFFNPTLTAMLRTTFHDQRDRVPYQGLQEWRALNTLAARLSVCEAHDLRFCAVIAMRDVLEEQTAVTADMLEVVTLWLSTQGYWLEAMAAYSVVTRKFYESPSKWFVYRLEEVAVTPGRLAGEAGVTGEDVSLPRWRFWRARLQALADADASTSPLAASALGRMINI
ncbi:hypothetical protein LTR91_015353 [Friedmanniomyces endolithicus]|uniref:Uncharacterized protein n=1 Tax=Friedmanniomyces endolithicus TaxID=329885 RepID=A0AAN6KA36_9PEZI|nr:hypothetical protein LTR94_006402 [Friedmanniomyces endolithicus]KAK0801199.1 hypothetical protein LTR59_005492 [Friedmanniomyces endolithicus]KAK0808197.1 hypothetical protein LTR38_004662 [Friedmanniomyces endolithicus]KAK0809114.1 hypothetical protein LTR75_006057 [Friedmanniomyces endolithicus]KAK0847946.1 hypothetical protein LTR03_006072 [Friedmanniomyces endolithicus]